MIEVTKFRLRDNVEDSDFLKKNASYQQRFVYQQDGLLRRTVASGLEGEWVAITHWRSMRDARRAVVTAATSLVAQEFQSIIEPGSESSHYFKELPG
jgi:hypothetical protein